VIVCSDVPFQLRAAKAIAQLVQRSAGNLEEARELLVLAPESFRDVSADGVDCIFRLRMELEIARETLSLGQLEHEDPNLIGELPDDQILVPFCYPHSAWESTART
jgi:hypothetical protein